jgi:hypothetical protein
MFYYSALAYFISEEGERHFPSLCKNILLTFSPETPDVLDRKMALDFYSRLRFTENLLPLLRHASSLSSSQSTREVLPAGGRVISVLGEAKRRLSMNLLCF